MAQETPAPPADLRWSPLQAAIVIGLLGFCGFFVWETYHPEDIYLTSLKYDVLAGETEPLEDAGWNGHPLQIAQTVYPRGLGVDNAATIELRYVPNGYKNFVAEIGLSAEEIPGGPEGVTFTVVCDGTIRYQSGVMKAGEPPVEIRVPVLGCKTLSLQVAGAPKGRAVWGLARFVHG
ncbi:MAG: hypothetical protein GC154_13025 [bacterium]|nr:hypothetical protein [bacterium]